MIRAFWVTLIMGMVMIDQVSKWFTEAMLPLQQQVDFLPFLSLYRTYNEGVAFSFLSSINDEFLIALTIAIICFVLWLWKNLESDRFLSELGYALVLGGAVGNLIDRIWLGKVIDMIYFHIDSIGFHFAIFNLADTFITLGAAAIILDEIIIWRQGNKNNEEHSHE